jgi:hypothetical protein
MEFLVQDIASQIGFSLYTTKTSRDNTQPSQDLDPSFIPNQQPSPNAPFFVSESRASTSQTSQRSPIGPLANDHPYQIPQSDYINDRGTPSTSAPIGNGSNGHIATAVYGTGTTTRSPAPAFIGPALHETFDNLVTFLPTQLPPLKRVIFEVEDEATEYALHQEFVRLNSAWGNWGTEFAVVRPHR